MKLETIAIFDLDGCVSNDEWRRNRIKDGAVPPIERYKEYHAGIGSDSIYSGAKYQIQEHMRKGHGIYFVTARPITYASASIDWIRRMIPDIDGKFALYMRPKDDHTRHSAELKSVIMAALLRHRNIEVVATYDDLESVCEAYNKLGLPSTLFVAGVAQKLYPQDSKRVHHVQVNMASSGEVALINKFALGTEPGGVSNAKRGLEFQPCDHQHEVDLAKKFYETAPDLTPHTHSVADHQHTGPVLKNSAPKHTVTAILEKAAATFEERNSEYRDNAALVGEVMAVLFPEGIKIRTEADHHFYHLFELMIVKLTRFTNSGLKHVDSIHDLMVYAAMVESRAPHHTIDTGAK